MGKTTPAIAVVISLLSIPAFGRAAEWRLPPVDEAYKDPGFVSFRDMFKRVLERRDVDSLLRFVAPDVRIAFEGHRGRDKFYDNWELDQPEKRKIWDTLRKLLELGGAYDDYGAFVAPYTFAVFPADFDSFECLVVTKRLAKLRLAPAPSSKVVAHLRYEIVERIETDASSDSSGWFHVKTKTGRTGYVSADDVRDPLDFRASFEEREGRWVLTVLVAGD